MATVKAGRQGEASPCLLVSLQSRGQGRDDLDGVSGGGFLGDGIDLIAVRESAEPFGQVVE